jgi:hypothetical protein
VAGGSPVAHIGYVASARSLGTGPDGARSGISVRRDPAGVVEEAAAEAVEGSVPGATHAWPTELQERGYHPKSE